MSGVPLKIMRSGTFLPSTMTARHSVKRSFSFPGGGGIHDVRGKRRGVFSIYANNYVVDVGADGRSMVLHRKTNKHVHNKYRKRHNIKSS